MLDCEIAVVGGGPAGLCAAAEASEWGAELLLLDRDRIPGGQLVKQTHRFFGSEAQRAGTRGIDIAGILHDRLEASPSATVWREADAVARYDDGVLGVERRGRWEKIRPKKLILATGAAEKTLAFPGSDLPGVYGAGAVQTLMNVHGVRPGHRVLMVGAGNIGLIVSYQLLQAKIGVAAVVEATHEVGGYWVHASKIRRLGVPILTGHTILEVTGTDSVRGAVVAEIDENWKIQPGTRREIECDAVCLAVGLGPLGDLMWQCGCEMAWISELGGYVPRRNEEMETSVEGVYVAGDAAGIEEASAAMMEGRLAGLAAAHALGYVPPDQFSRIRSEIASELHRLRSGPTGDVTRRGLAALRGAPVRRQVLVEEGEPC